MKTFNRITHKAKQNQIKWFVIVLITLFCTKNSHAQNTIGPFDLYVSKQTGTSTSYNGEKSYETGYKETGEFQFFAPPSLNILVSPQPTSLGENSSQTWHGTVSVNAALAPAPGLSVPVTVKGVLKLTYFRPEELGGANARHPGIRDHHCNVSKKGNMGVNDGCKFHGPDGGWHEKVNGIEQGDMVFNIHSLNAIVIAPDSVCPNTDFIITANGYPAGGSFTWSDGGTGQTRTVKINQNTTFTVTYNVAGITYSAQKFVKARKSAPWKTVEQEVPQELIKPITDKLTEAVNAIPGAPEMEIDGPNIKFTFKSRPCCGAPNDPNGEIEGSGTLAMSIKANNIPIASPPFTASFKKSTVKFGYRFEVEGKYGAFLDATADISGTLGSRENKCTTTKCGFGNVELGFSPRFHFTVSGKVCMTSANARVQSCGTCGRQTRNWCGYCDDHTGDSWWCVGCPEFSLTPAAISNRLFGRIGYNERSCNDGLRYRVGFSETVFTFSAGIAGYNFEFPVTVAPAFDLISNY